MRRIKIYLKINLAAMLKESNSIKVGRYRTKVIWLLIYFFMCKEYFYC